MKKTETVQPCFCFRKTPFGPVAVLWSLYEDAPKIQRVVLSAPGFPAPKIIKTVFSDLVSASCTEVDGVADQIAAFLNGDDIRFQLDMVRMDLCTQFQQKVLRAEHGIPRGRVSTYQRIARHIGNSKGARAVGTALAKNPFPLIIPCHRAVRSDGTLGGYQGGLEMKRTLLEMEGVYSDTFDRVLTKPFFY